MNAAVDPSGIAPSASLQPAAMDDAGSTGFVLRRTGLRPLKFFGSQIVDAKGSRQADYVSHDVNIYRTAKGKFVAEVIARRIASDQPDVFRVESFDTLDAAAAWLQTFPAADDASIPIGLGAGTTALPWAVLKAVQLRQQMDRIDSEYRALLTEIFMAMDLTETGDEDALPAAKR